MRSGRTGSDKKSAKSEAPEFSDHELLYHILYKELKLKEYCSDKNQKLDANWDDIIPQVRWILKEKLSHVDSQSCINRFEQQIKRLENKQAQLRGLPIPHPNLPVIEPIPEPQVPESKEAPEIPLSPHAALIFKYIRQPIPANLDEIVQLIAPKELPAAFKQLSERNELLSTDKTPEDRLKTLKSYQLIIYKEMATIKTRAQANWEYFKKAFWFGLKVVCTLGLYLCWHSWSQEKPYKIEQRTVLKDRWENFQNASKLIKLLYLPSSNPNESKMFNRVGELKKVVVENPNAAENPDADATVTIFATSNQFDRIRILSKLIPQVAKSSGGQELKTVAAMHKAIQASKQESRSIIASARPRLA
jgi:RNAse (barnase) inhibitor barstar